MITPRKYQEEGRDWIKVRKRAILADDMGLGKTLQALLAAKELSAHRVLIVSPKSVMQSWCDKAVEYGVAENISKISAKHKKIVNKWNIINYDLLTQDWAQSSLSGTRWDVVIFDEAHALKNYEAKRTRYVFSRDGIGMQGKHVWFLTGTPVLNRPCEIFPIMRGAFPELLRRDGMDFTKFKAFALAFCAGYYGKWGFDYSGASNIERLARLLRPVMLRRLKSDVLGELPPYELQAITLDSEGFTAELQEQFKAFECGGLEAQADKLNEKLMAAKVSQSIELIIDMLASKEKIVVYAHHHATIEILTKGLEQFKPVTYYGKTTDTERTHAIERFTRGDSRVFIGGISACATGTDGLQHATDTCVFVEMVWTPAVLEQAVSRLHRIGQKGNVLAIFVMYQGSVDEYVFKTLMKKESVIGQLLGEERKFMTSMVDVDTVKLPKQKETAMGIEKYFEEKFAAVQEQLNRIEELLKSSPVTTEAVTVEPVKKAGRPKKITELTAAVETAVVTVAPVPVVEAPFDYKKELQAAELTIRALGDQKKMVQIVMEAKKKCAEFGHTSMHAVTDPVQQKTIIEFIRKLVKELA